MHKEKYPVPILLTQMLISARDDIGQMDEKLQKILEARSVAADAMRSLLEASREFVDGLSSAQRVAHWMYNPEYDDTALPFDDVCMALRLDPDEVRECMTHSVPENLLRMVMGGKHVQCPLCGAKEAVFHVNAENRHE